MFQVLELYYHTLSRFLCINPFSPSSKYIFLSQSICLKNFLSLKPASFLVILPSITILIVSIFSLPLSFDIKIPPYLLKRQGSILIQNRDIFTNYSHMKKIK